jgi:hypothetical protein
VPSGGWIQSMRAPQGTASPDQVQETGRHLRRGEVAESGDSRMDGFHVKRSVVLVSHESPVLPSFLLFLLIPGGLMVIKNVHRCWIT